MSIFPRSRQHHRSDGQGPDGLRYLAAADPTTLAAEAQADCLQGFEQSGAMSTAARAWFLAAFTARQGYSEDADYSPTAWPIHRTKVTKGAARGQWAGPAVRWLTRRSSRRWPRERADRSMALTICGWTDKLPRSASRPPMAS